MIKFTFFYALWILNLHRIDLEVYSYNEIAINTYERVGFKREAIQREVLFYNHKYHDAILMSILEDEYRLKYNK